MDALINDIITNLDDVYIIAAMYVWLLCNLTIFVWSDKPEYGSKYYKLYKLINLLANTIPIDLLIRVLLSRKRNKSNRGDNAKKSD